MTLKMLGSDTDILAYLILTENWSDSEGYLQMDGFQDARVELAQRA